MIHLCKWRWTVFICVLAIAVGVLHGMTHVEFSQLYSQLFDDIDRLCELFTNYVSHIVMKLVHDKKSAEFKLVTNHYGQMMKKAQPLFKLFSDDKEKLLTFMDNLESISLLKKFLYTYFRQSAINLIDHLKRVYNLE